MQACSGGVPVNHPALRRRECPMGMGSNQLTASDNRLLRHPSASPDIATASEPDQLTGPDQAAIVRALNPALSSSSVRHRSIPAGSSRCFFPVIPQASLSPFQRRRLNVPYVEIPASTTTCVLDGRSRLIRSESSKRARGLGVGAGSGRVGAGNGREPGRGRGGHDKAGGTSPRHRPLRWLCCAESTPDNPAAAGLPVHAGEER